MTIALIRLIQLLLIPFIVASKEYYLLYYNGVMHVSLEFLNSKTEYTTQPKYKFYNALFVIFLVLYSLERLRTRTFKLSTWLEWQMNSVEHIFFAFIICFKIVQYLNLRYFGALSLEKRILTTFIAFNIIGVLGEIFQLCMTDDYKLVFWVGAFDFLPDNIKDIKMNLIGSALFCLSLFYFSRRKVHL
jgi:hypothetical protein